MTQTPQDQPSASTPPRSKVQLVSEKRVGDPGQPQQNSPTLTQMISAATAPSSPFTQPVQVDRQQQEFIHRAAWKASVLGALNVLVQVVAVRVIVLVAVSGGIVLAALSLSSPDPWRLGVLAIYALAVVVPVVWLASRH